MCLTAQIEVTVATACPSAKQTGSIPESPGFLSLGLS